MKIVFFLLFLSISAFSQQAGVPNLLIFNKLDYNPAVTGSDNGIGITFLSRSEMQYKYALGQASIFLSKQKIGAGLLTESFQSLLETQTNINLNISYRMQLRKGFLQLGLAPVLHNFKLNADRLAIRNSEDVNAPTQNQNIWNFNYNAGIIFKSNKLFVSLSAFNLAKNHADRNNYAWLSNQYGLSSFASYTFAPAESWKYIPSVSWQYSAHTHFMAISNQLVYKFLFIGLQYGLYSNWGLSAGFWQEEMGKAGRLYAGYTFSSRSLGLTKMFVHEVFINMSFGKTKSLEADKMKKLPLFHSPVYF